MVTGPPGAGKSAVACELGGRFERSVVVEGDLFYSFLAAGAIEPWLVEARVQNDAVARSAALCTASLADDFDTVYEGVVGPWQLDGFMAAGGFEALDDAVLLPPLDMCLQRVAERIGHGFTDAGATRHMHEQFVEADIDERHVIHVGREPVEHLADLITARRSTGSLRRAT